MSGRAPRFAWIRLRSECGAITLPELLASSAMMLVIFAAILGIAHTAQRQSTGTEDRIHTLLDQRTGLERMVRLMRDASEVLDARYNNGKGIRFRSPSRGDVTLDCGGNVCKATYGGTTRTLVRGLVNDEFGQNAICVRGGSHRGVRYVRVHLLVRPPPRPGTNVQTAPIGLAGGASMRNVVGDPELQEEC